MNAPETYAARCERELLERQRAASPQVKERIRRRRELDACARFWARLVGWNDGGR